MAAHDPTGLRVIAGGGAGATKPSTPELERAVIYPESACSPGAGSMTVARPAEVDG